MNIDQANGLKFEEQYGVDFVSAGWKMRIIRLPQVYFEATAYGPTDQSRKSNISWDPGRQTSLPLKSSWVNDTSWTCSL